MIKICYGVNWEAFLLGIYWEDNLFALHFGPFYLAFNSLEG